jgi:hypothetical protein
MLTVAADDAINAWMATGPWSVACVACVAAAALGGGCGASGGTPDEELAGLVHAAKEQAPAIDVARAASDPDALGAAIAAPEHRITDALGPHVLASKSSVVVSDGGAVVESLIDEVALDDGGAAFHGTENNSADYGREVIATAGQVYLRPRYARWHARKPEDGELARLRDDLGGALAADYDLLAPAVAVADRGEAQAAGRPARRIVLSKASITRARTQTLTQRKWREAAEVLAVSGEVLLDAKTGAPLHAHVEGEVAFARDGHRYTMKLSIDHDVSAIGAVAAIAPPPADDTVATPERLREVDERDLLLQNLAPPTKRQQPVAGAGSAAGSGTGAGTKPP